MLQNNDLDQQEVQTLLPPMNRSNTTCASAFNYTGELCREELLSQRESCFLEPQTSDLLILNNPSQMFMTQISTFRVFGSPECVAAGIPFLCLLTLGVCDNNGTQFLPSKETCIEISNGACRMEFEQARALGLGTPDCSILPEEEFSVCSILESTTITSSSDLNTTSTGLNFTILY